MLDRLEPADRAAELAALLRVREGVVERALREPERLRAEDHALVVETRHQLSPAAALGAEQRVLRHAAVVEVELVGLLAAERRDRRDREPLGVARDEDHRDPLVRVVGPFGAADDEDVACLVRVRAPHLRSVQHPFAVVALRRGL